MTRAVFDTTADIWQGPAGVVPNAFRGTFPCRLVLEDAIQTVGMDAPIIPYYMTLDGVEPAGVWSGKVGIGTFSRADLVAIPTGSTPRFRVIYSDAVNWGSQAQYYRSYLVGGALYAVAVCGGSIGLGEAVIVGKTANVTIIVGSGVTIAGGSVCVVFRKASSPCVARSAALAGGSANLRYRAASIWVLRPSGSAVGIGAAKVVVPVRGRPCIGSTAALASGIAEYVFTPNPPVTDYWLDTFTDSDGTALTAHSPEVGGSYSTILGTFKIDTNQCVMDAPSFDLSTVGFDPGQTTWQADIEFTIQTAANDPNRRTMYFYFRNDGVANNWYIQVNFPAGDETTTGFDLYKRNTGVDTIEATGSVTLSTAVTYTLHLDVSPTGISATIAGTSVNVTDSHAGTETKMVMQFYSTSPTSGLPAFDNLHVYG